MAGDFRKFDDGSWARITDNLADEFRKDPEKFRQRIGAQQVALYVMVGGGMIGRSYTQQPEGAYVDSRVSKRPYAQRAIDQMQKMLVVMAQVAGYDPSGFNRDGKPNLPEMPNFHGAGVF